jgi:hypothetical protein
MQVEASRLRQLTTAVVVGLSFCLGTGPVFADWRDAMSMNNRGVQLLQAAPQNSPSFSGNLALARQLFTQAAETGSSMAMENLIKLYLGGSGAQPDPAQASYWKARLQQTSDRYTRYCRRPDIAAAMRNLMAKFATAQNSDPRKRAMQLFTGFDPDRTISGLIDTKLYEAMGQDGPFNCAAKFTQRVSATADPNADTAAQLMPKVAPMMNGIPAIEEFAFERQPDGRYLMTLLETSMGKFTALVDGAP